MKRKILLAFLALTLCLSTLCVCMTATEAEGDLDAKIASYAGKKVSLIGDSISTYKNVSNNTSYNSTIGNNAVYYTPGRLGINLADTWWQQVIDALDMELLVNNSWSGSTIFPPHKGEGSQGYLTRCVNLHNDTTGEKPDIIWVYLGTNDYSSAYIDIVGTAADIDYAALIKEENGAYSYAEPTTVCEAYAIMLHKMKVAYPDAEIYCMTLLPKRSTALAGQPTVFNGYLKEIATHMNCALIDLENCGIRTEAEDFDTYIADHGLHPGPKGMDMISKTVLSAMLEEPQHGITNNLQSTSTNNSVYYVTDGGSYSSTISLDEGYAGTDIKVTMGDEDITASAVSGNNVNIENVTGDVRIYATGTRDGMSSRFEIVDGALASVTTDGNSENKLILTSGSVSDSVLNNAIYDIEKDIILKHDKKWVIEWKGSGVWSGMLLSSNATAGVVDAPYIFKTANTETQLLAFGAYISQKYHNYGIPLALFNIDFTAEHTYRLENRIAADGTNTVYLLLDGAELGAMNQHYISASESQSENVNYVNGKDFYFKSIGTDDYPVNGIALEYLQIWEEGDPNAVEKPEPTIISSGEQRELDTSHKNYDKVLFTWTLDSNGTLTFYPGVNKLLETAYNESKNNIKIAFDTWRKETPEGYSVTNENLVKTIIVSDGFTYIRNQHNKPIAIFGGWPELTKIIIPSGVYFVNNYTNEGFFNNNPKLTTLWHSGVSVNNRKGVINLEKITRFDGANGTVPNFEAFFKNCPAIKEVILPSKNTSDSTTNTTVQMFYGCTGLEKVTIPSFFTAIGDGMFYNCSSLETLTIPSTIETIAANAITGCSGLKTITIENTALDISGLTIPDNEGLTINCASKAQRDAINAMGLANVTANYELPKSNLMADGSGYQYTYDEGIFTVSKATTTASTVLDYDIALDFTAEVTTVIITEESGITSISANMFDGWNASTIVVPSTLTTVGAKAFANMPNLKTVADYTAYTADSTAGDGVINLLTVTSIAMDAFSGSSSALSPVVYFGKSAAFTGETFDFFAEDATETFYVYPSTSATTFFRDNSIAFEYLTAEQTGDELLAREYSNWVFDTEAGKLTWNLNGGHLNVGKGATAWPNWKAVWKDAIEYFFIENATTSGAYIYYQHNDSPLSNLPNLKHAHMGGIKVLRRSYNGNGLFKNCPSLTTVSYGDDSTYDEVIDLTWWTKNEFAMTEMFFGCTAIKEVILPTKLAIYKESTSPSIGIFEKFFYNCSNLVRVEVPDCFTYIGKNAFYGCTSLEEVKILNNNISVSSVTATSFPKETRIIVYSATAAETLSGLGLNVVDLTNPVTAEGFSIRYEDYNGLRAIFSFDEAQNKVYAENGYILKEYGIIATSARDYNYWGGITLKNRFGEYVTEATGIKKMPVYKDGVIIGKTLSSSVEGERVDFAGTVVNFTANFTSDLYIGAYTVYINELGEEFIHQIYYSDAAGNNLFNLYDITLDMLKNHETSGILSSSIDEKAVWNTVLQGADTEFCELAVGENEGITLTLVKDCAEGTTYVPIVRSEKGAAITEAVLTEAEALIPAEIALNECGIISAEIADMGTTAPEFKESIVYSPTVSTPRRFTRYATPDPTAIYGAQHPQGMTMDDRGNIYVSFTGLLVKLNQKGEEVGIYKLSNEMISISTHLGNIYWHEGKIYIGLGISDTDYSGHKRYIGVLDESVFNDYGGYVQDTEDAPLLHALNIPELSVDRLLTDSNGTAFAKFGGGGIDGITVGKLPGKGYILPAGYVVKEDIKASDGTVYTAGTVLTEEVEVTDNEDYIVAVRTQGSYDTYRYDDDNKQVMVFDFDDITEENLLPMNKERVGKDDPTGIYIKYNMFVYNGYHEYGTQVICHDKNTGDYQLWTYERAAKNNEFPDGSFYVIDGSKKLRLEEIEVGQSVPEDSEQYAVASDRAALYVDEKDLDNDGDTSERLIGWVATLRCVCGNYHDIEDHEAVVYGETGYAARICGMHTTLQGDNGCISLGNDFFYIMRQTSVTAYRADGVTTQSAYGAEARIYSLSRHHGAWKFTQVTSW